MTQLDLRRKIALVMIAIAGIFFISLAASQKENTTQSVAIAQAPSASRTFEGGEFIVYQDKPSSANHYAASGYMPDGKCIQVDDAWTEDCKEGRSCIKTFFDSACVARNQNWGGIYWLDPANNWGERKGGFNLTGAKKLTFWARGERGDEVIVVFKVGGVMGEFPDSDSSEIGPVTLTRDWKQYTIDLKAKDLSRIIGGFAWVTNAPSNPRSATFYLDDIHFE